MRKEKLIYAIPVFILLLFGAVQLAEAALTVTWQSPTTGTTIAGTTFFNVTTAPDPYNCTVQIYSSSTANSTQYTVFTMYNTTYGNATNATYLTSRFEDANDYSIVATCTNQTAGATGQGTATLSNMIIDNSVPLTPTSPTIAANTRIKTKDNSTLNFSITVTGNQTTACTFFIGPNGGAQYNSYTATHTGDTCNYVWTVSEGSLQYYMRASDGTNTTDSSVITNLDVVGGVSSGAVAAAIIASGGQVQTAEGVSGGDQKTTGGLTPTAIILIAAAALILWQFVLKKKK